MPNIFISFFLYSVSFFFFSCKKYNIRRDVYNEKLMYLYNTQTTILLLILFFWLHPRRLYIFHIIVRMCRCILICMYVCNETCICRPTAYSYRHLVKYRYSTRISQEEDNSKSYSNPSWHICSWEKNCMRKQTLRINLINIIHRWFCTLSFRAFG